MEKRYEKKPAEEPAATFTSMIDIVFLLLIFFVLQPFKSPDMKLNSELPRGGDVALKYSIPIELSVRGNPGAGPGAAVFMINRRSIGRDGGVIWQELLHEARGDQSVPITLQADSDVRFKHVLTALDQCYKAEMKNVRFAAP